MNDDDRFALWAQRVTQALAGGVDSHVEVVLREARFVRVNLSGIVPGETTYEELLRLCGSEMEEREDLAMPRRKTVVYRGRRDVPHRRWGWSWLATVSHWDVERHEVEIILENGVVQELQVRLGRSRSARP